MADPVANPILQDIKKMLGIIPNCNDFNTDILIHINSALLSINQIGVGPEEGIILTEYGDDTWVDIIGERLDLNAVKTLVYLKVKILFDPPQTQYVNDAYERQIKDYEWRINVQVEKEEST